MLFAGYDCACGISLFLQFIGLQWAYNKKHLKSIHNLKSVLHKFENDSRLNALNNFFGFAHINNVFSTLLTSEKCVATYLHKLSKNL